MWTGSETITRASEHSVTSPIIETLGVSKVYKSGGVMVTPASDITMRVGYGDFAVIFGRSGAGKSTLMNMLMGLDSPDIGEVYLKGESLFGYSEEQRTTIRRKKISYLPPTTHWIEGMSVVDNVALPLYLLGAGQRKARQKSVTDAGRSWTPPQIELKASSALFRSTANRFTRTCLDQRPMADFCR